MTKSGLTRISRETPCGAYNSQNVRRDVTHGMPGRATNDSFELYFDGIAVGSRFFFEANDGFHGREPFVSNGTERGTFMLANIATSFNSSNPGRFTSFHRWVVFTARSDDGHELWITDGTRAGTRSLGGIDASSSLSVIGNNLYVVDETQRLWQLSKSLELTPLGYLPAGDYRFGDEMSDGTFVILIRRYSTRSVELWSSDGTGAGTRKVREFENFRLDLTKRPTLLSGRTVFSLDRINSDEPGELWSTDGSLAGTELLTAHWPGSDAVVNDRVYSIDVGTSRLWSSAGTPETTTFHDITTELGEPVLLSQIEVYFDRLALFGMPEDAFGLGGVDSPNYLLSGASTAVPSSVTFLKTIGERVGSSLYYLDDYKLWMQESPDGEPTEIVMEAMPRDIRATEHHLFVMAEDGLIGKELWTVPLTEEPIGWHNEVAPSDVDGNELVTPIDALLVINELNNRDLTEIGTGRVVGTNSVLQYVDVDNDGYVSPTDALLVINQLNTPTSSANLVRRYASPYCASDADAERNEQDDEAYVSSY